MNIELVFLLIYFIVVISIGLAVSRTASKDRAGYLLGAWV